ncbi:hypothetical protein GE107_05890 [Cohnella sp. CFH 77786]|uniref:WD40/YVTN/BNR-like repeat-containing protein n=1 Tax=Cohnella sp. CFH 77786 TaxID=2662265 RepID=UPI001C6103EA|nr:hypothetical protein [Cohnella sp. CFH 77786]MBW5445593.1 hypothetical protein [Cohnella sp. CFH 77786]
MTPKRRRGFGGFLLSAALLLAVIGCSGVGGGASPATSPASTAPPAEASPAPAASPSAAPTETSPSLPTPVNPPSVSTYPDAGDQATGKVTAVRLADPQTGWAGGDGWIARTTDGGKHWNVQLRPPYLVLQIFALDADRAWTSLDLGDKRGTKLIRTTDGGKRWKDAGTVPNFSFFHFVSENEAFSGSAYTTDGGKTWTALPAPEKTVGDVYFHDAKNGWAVTNGHRGFSIRRTTDGGKTWPAVFTRGSEVLPTNAVIRSAGKDDAWVELIGDSGMSQTSYSLFHTMDGGKSWQPVLAHSGAGSGPAPGFAMDEKKVPRNKGASPGTLYVVNPKVAFMGGQCMACDNGNTLGKTTDGGKSWINLEAEFPGYGPQQLAAADAKHVWWITTDEQEPSRMYVTSDGGEQWTLVHTFDKPKT